MQTNGRASWPPTMSTTLAKTSKLACLSLVLVWLTANQAPGGHALRTGAPSLACLNMRPVHGLYRPRPASSSQFFVRQSSLTYEPNQNVTVEIATHSSERNFRGFMLQAYDPSSGRPIGQFLATADSHPIESCSAATHRNNQNKKQVSLVWLPPTPANGGGAGAAGQPADGSSLTSWLTSALTSAGGNQKRQLAEPAPPPAPQPPPVAGNATGDGQSPLSKPPGGSPVSAPVSAAHAKQVRFRATIVVSYQEFYTEFESSELKFDKFGYSP